MHGETPGRTCVTFCILSRWKRNLWIEHFLGGRSRLRPVGFALNDVVGHMPRSACDKAWWDCYKIITSNMTLDL
jgi:hypothetical protein